MDDLEWADAATLEVLDYASKRWAEQGASVLLLIAARLGEPEVGSYFERWLSTLGRKLPMVSLTLGPLGDEEVNGLLGRLGRTDSKPDGALEGPGSSIGAEPLGLESFGEWLLSETGGQPFYLVETLKALLEDERLVIRSRADGNTAEKEVRKRSGKPRKHSGSRQHGGERCWITERPGGKDAGPGRQWNGARYRSKLGRRRRARTTGDKGELDS